LTSSSLINVMSKIGAAAVVSTHQKQPDPTSPALSPANKKDSITAVPSMTAQSLSVPGNMDTSTMGLSEALLKRQALECLAAVLRSLVVWGTAAGRIAEESLATSEKPRVGEDVPVTPEPLADKAYSQSSDQLRQSTPDVADDPSRFESAKQKKNTFSEGVKRFNFKPKKV
jgi:brefeldin A-inhibited guanine nucleotide-exchange protein